MVWYAPRVRAAFGQDPMSDPTLMSWTLLTDYVAGFSCEGGRDYVFATQEPGTATLHLHNQDGRFTPGNAGLGTNLLPYNVVRPGRLDPVIDTADGGEWWLLSTGAGYSHVIDTTTIGIENPMLKTTVPSGGNVNVRVRLPGPGTVRVSPSTAYSFSCRLFRSTASTVTGRIFIHWYTSSMTYISESTTTAAAISSTNTTRVNLNNVTSPATAYYARVGYITTVAPTASVNIYWGDMVLQQGSTTSATNLGNPWYGLFVPGLPVQISTPSSGGTQREHFHGIVDTVSVSDEGDEESSMATVLLADPSRVLVAQELSSGPNFMYDFQGVDVHVPLTDQLSSNKKGTLSFELEARVGDVTPKLKRHPRDAAAQASFTGGQDGIAEDAGTSIKLTPTQSASDYYWGWRLFPLGDESLDHSSSWTISLWFRTSSKPVAASMGFELLALYEKSPTDTLAQCYTWFVGAAGNIGTRRNYGLGVTVTSEDDVLDYTKPNVTDGQFHNLVVTHSASTGDVVTYVDGVKVNYRDSLAAWDTTDIEVMVGAGRNWDPTPDYWLESGTAFDGFLSHVVVDYSAWSEKEVQDLYDGIVSDTPWSGETDVERVDRLLELGGWSTNAAARVLPTTPAGTVGGLESGETLERAIRRVEATFGGRFYFDKDGKATYVQNDADLDMSLTIAVSEANANMPEAELDFTFDDQHVVNEVTVRDTSGFELTLKDDESIAKYGRRTASYDVTTTSVNDLYSAASWYLYSQKDALPRLSAVTFNVSTMPDAGWNDFIQVARPGTTRRIDLSGALRGNDPDIDTLYFVDRYTYEVDADTRTVMLTLDLSPTFRHVEVLTLDSNTLGQLDMYPLAP